MTMITLKHRQDFIKAAQSSRHRARGLILMARYRGEESTDDIRVGFTSSKRIGGACTRNRAKRRLREAARIVLTKSGRPGWDYVLVSIAHKTLKRKFSSLLMDLNLALQKVHAQ